MWKVDLGAYAGINTRIIVKVKYYNENDNFKKVDYTLDNRVNAFFFGGKFSLGYGVSLYLSKKISHQFLMTRKFYQTQTESNSESRLPILIFKE